MPRAKPKPQPQPSPAAVNGDATDVMTLSEAAAYLRLPEEEVLRMVREQNLAARQVGSEWRFSREAILRWLGTGPGPKSNKEAWAAWAGSWKDDPDLERIVEEAYRARGRPITEDGSYKNFTS